MVDERLNRNPNHLNKTIILSKALVFHCFLVFRRMGELISLDLLCFVSLTSSCSLTLLKHRARESVWNMMSPQTLRAAAESEHTALYPFTQMVSWLGSILRYSGTG